MTSTQTPERLSDDTVRELASGVGMGPRGERLYADHRRARAVESSQAEQLAALRSQLEQTQAQEIAVRRSVRQVAERCRPGWVSEELDVIGAKTDAGGALLDRLERAERELKRAEALERWLKESVIGPRCEELEKAFKLIESHSGRDADVDEALTEVECAWLLLRTARTATRDEAVAALDGIAKDASARAALAPEAAPEPCDCEPDTITCGRNDCRKREAAKGGESNG